MPVRACMFSLEIMKTRKKVMNLVRTNRWVLCSIMNVDSEGCYLRFQFCRVISFSLRIHIDFEAFTQFEIGMMNIRI